MADVVTREEDLDALLESRRDVDTLLWMWENAAAFDEAAAADWPEPDPDPEPLALPAAAPVAAAPTPAAAPAPTPAPEQARFRFLTAGKAEIEAKAASLLTNKHTARATQASAALFDDEYLSLCPPVKTQDDPLYLRPLTKITTARLWFTANPCGYNFLSEILKKLSDKVPALQNRKITSHSARASFVSALFGDLNMPEELIMEMSKHVSTDGVRKYKRANPSRALVASDVVTTTLRTERTERTITTVAVSAAPSAPPAPPAAAPVTRGPYSCTQCRQPKRNHVCALTPPAGGAVPVRPVPAPGRPAPAPVAVRKRSAPPVTTRAGRVVRRKCED